MFLNKYNLKIKDFTADSGLKPELNGVFITNRETVATDSICLIRVQAPKLDIKEFPTPDKKTKYLKDIKPFILPKGEAQKILESIPNNSTLPILDNAVISKQNCDSIEIITTNLEGFTTRKSKVIEGEFPNYKEVLTKKGKHTKVLLDVKYLKKIVDYFNQFGDNTRPTIEIEIPTDNETPVRFSCKNNQSDQKAEAILMPIQSE